MKKIIDTLLIVFLCITLILPCVTSCSHSSQPTATSASVMDLSKLNITEYDNIDYNENKFYILNKNTIYIVDATSFSVASTISLDTEYCYINVNSNSVYLADKNNSNLWNFHFPPIRSVICSINILFRNITQFY